MQRPARSPRPYSRYLGSTLLLLFAVAPISAIVSRPYGPLARRRFYQGTGAAVLLQQVFVLLLLRRNEGSEQRSAYSLRPIDVITLTRGGAAALLAGITASRVRDRAGRAGWAGWFAVLYGAILCDWLDGPLARRFGVSELGAILDLEADSWLTFLTALAATSWGGLSRLSVLPALARYPVLLLAIRHTPYHTLHSNSSPWVRRTGIAQMLLFLAALAPFAGRSTRYAVRLAAPIHAPVLLLGLVVQYRRRG